MRHTRTPATRETIIVVSWLALLGCAGNVEQDTVLPPAGSLPESVLGTTWEWVATVTPVERVRVADPSRYTITLHADGTVAALFDCNRGRGRYEADEHQIRFGPFATTRIACPEDTQDFQFIGHLERVSSYFVQDGELFLEAPYDSGTLRFRAADSP